MKNLKNGIPVGWLIIKKTFKVFLLVGFCLGVSSCATQRMVHKIPKLEAPQEYFAVFLNGKKIGHSTKCRIVESNKIFTITNEVMKVNRFGMTVEMAGYTKHVENPDGQPIAFERIENTNSKFLFFNEKKSKRIEGVRKEDGYFKITKNIQGKSKD